MRIARLSWILVAWGIGACQTPAAKQPQTAEAKTSARAPADAPVIEARQAADNIYLAMQTFFSTYEEKVVRRLQDQEGVIAASEDYERHKALPVPIQMVLMSATAINENTDAFSIDVRALTPNNKKHLPKSDFEKNALDAVAKSKAPFYAEEAVSGKRRFVGVYPQEAKVGCVACHNSRKNAPRRDLKEGDVLGAYFIRIPVK